MLCQRVFVTHLNVLTCAAPTARASDDTSGSSTRAFIDRNVRYLVRLAEVRVRASQRQRCRVLWSVVNAHCANDSKHSLYVNGSRTCNRDLKRAIQCGCTRPACTSTRGCSSLLDYDSCYRCCFGYLGPLRQNTKSGNRKWGRRNSTLALSIAGNACTACTLLSMTCRIIWQPTPCRYARHQELQPPRLHSSYSAAKGGAF